MQAQSRAPGSGRERATFLQKGLESADLIADRFAATGKVECTARIAAHERKTLFRKMLLAPHGIARHRTASHGIAWLRMESEPSI